MNDDEKKARCYDYIIGWKKQSSAHTYFFVLPFFLGPRQITASSESGNINPIDMTPKHTPETIQTATDESVRPRGPLFSVSMAHKRLYPLHQP